MNGRYALLLFGLALCAGCHQEDTQALRQIEDVLPGTWSIEQVLLPGYGLGITYEGTTFYTDTILYDVGSITIAGFNARTLDISNPAVTPAPCMVRIGDETFPYQMDHIISREGRVFSYFRSSHQGVEPIDTPAEKFLWSSYVFQNNYYIAVVDPDHVRLDKANAEGRHVIYLERIK